MNKALEQQPIDIHPSDPRFDQAGNRYKITLSTLYVRFLNSKLKQDWLLGDQATAFCDEMMQGKGFVEFLALRNILLQEINKKGLFRFNPYIVMMGSNKKVEHVLKVHAYSRKRAAALAQHFHPSHRVIVVQDALEYQKMVSNSLHIVAEQDFSRIAAETRPTVLGVSGPMLFSSKKDPAWFRLMSVIGDRSHQTLEEKVKARSRGSVVLEEPVKY